MAVIEDKLHFYAQNELGLQRDEVWHSLAEVSGSLPQSIQPSIFIQSDMIQAERTTHNRLVKLTLSLAKHSMCRGREWWRYNLRDCISETSNQGTNQIASKQILLTMLCERFS